MYRKNETVYFTLNTDITNLENIFFLLENLLCVQKYLSMHVFINKYQFLL